MPGVQREQTPTLPSARSALVPGCPAPSGTGPLEPGGCGECGDGHASFLFPQPFPSGLWSHVSARPAPASIFTSLGSVIRVAKLCLTGRSLVNVPSVLCTAPCPCSGVGVTGQTGFLRAGRRAWAGGHLGGQYSECPLLCRLFSTHMTSLCIKTHRLLIHFFRGSCTAVVW